MNFRCLRRRCAPRQPTGCAAHRHGRFSRLHDLRCAPPLVGSDKACRARAKARRVAERADQTCVGGRLARRRFPDGRKPRPRGGDSALRLTEPRGSSCVPIKCGTQQRRSRGWCLCRRAMRRQRDRYDGDHAGGAQPSATGRHLATSRSRLGGTRRLPHTAPTAPSEQHLSAPATARLPPVRGKRRPSRAAGRRADG